LLGKVTPIGDGILSLVGRCSLKKIRLNFNETIGGRTRTRTLDPLISHALI